MSDDYRTVTARVKAIRSTSILIEHSRQGTFHWIPRSLIHGGDDWELDRFAIDPAGTTRTLRLREWKAEELGLS